MRAQARAILLALIYALFFILGTPGLDFMDDQDLGSADARQRLKSRIGPVWATIGLGIYDSSRVVRAPLVKLLDPLQKPFRLSQNWSLYRDGPGSLWRMEIRVDDRAIYRSVDTELSWEEAVFRNRRVRPVVEASTQKLDSKNWRGLCRLIRERALEDYPATRRIDVLALKSPFPGDKLVEHHRYTMEAPDFHPILVQAAQ
jgi:hypothetical protein